MALTKLSTDVIDLSDNTEALTIPKGTSNSTVDVEYLVVGGGGGGGGRAAGGGGAGGYLSNYGGTKLGVNFSNNLIVTIGTGGGGGGLSTRGGSGSNSIFSIIDSNGGGGGGYYLNVSGLSGGSGGGGGAGSTPGGGGGGATPSGQGFNGGTGQGVNQSAAGGGGGASEVGVSPSVSGVSGDGGDGLQNNIDGLNLYYAGGGGGSANHTYNGAGGNGGGGTGGTNSIQAIAGTDGRGGGGGGGAYDNTGRAGGNGVVIIRYVTSNATLTIGGGLTHSSTTIGSETIVTFTAGSDNISFAGTGTGRPSSPTEGLMRENTTTGKMEFYDGSLWQEITDTANTYVSGFIPSANFNTVIYTGTNAAQSISTVGFEPGMVWFKNRMGTNSHAIVDSVRTRSSYLYPDDSFAANTSAASNDMTSFDSEGFSLGVVSQAGSTNTTTGGTNNIVAWNWKAGGAATTIASGTNGSTVASDVSANQAAGFSIVQYTTAGSKIISHGLSQAPELIIQKRTDVTSEWVTYTATTGLQKYLQLQSDAAVVSDANFMTAVGASTFTSQWSSNSHDYINYCFHSIPGYSKIGFYVGTGATQNIYLGFKPAWVMFKSIDSGASFSSWVIFDNKRNTSNPRTCEIYPNLNLIEYCTTGSAPNYRGLNFTDTGIELLSTSYSNEAFETFIYMAFSE